MAGSWDGEAGASKQSIPVPWLSGAVASGGQNPSSILPYLIWMIMRSLHQLEYSLPIVIFLLLFMVLV